MIRMFNKVVQRALERLSRRTPEPLEPLACHTLAFVETVLEPSVEVATRWNVSADLVVERALLAARAEVYGFDLERHKEASERYKEAT